MVNTKDKKNIIMYLLLNYNRYYYNIINIFLILSIRIMYINKFVNSYNIKSLFKLKNLERFIIT